MIAGCSGGSSGSGNAGADGGPGGRMLSLTASPAVVARGAITTLIWSARGATRCEASGGWSGARALSGSETVGPIEQNTPFRLSCSGDAGGASREVTVSIDGNGPALTLEADPDQVVATSAATLIWSASGATSCTASGGWSGPRATSGSLSTGPLTQTTSYSLSCTGASGNALASVTVEVLDKILRWQAPTQNVDGSPLTDLAGFKIYWGTQSRTYGPPHVIHDPAATRWEADLPAGNYYFALTAFDAEGTESGYSNEVIKTIP